MIVGFARHEWIADVPMSAVDQQFQLPTQGGQIPSDRFLKSLLLQYQGRMTNPSSGGPTGVLADAPMSIMERIHVGGYHRLRGAREEFIDIRGADLWQLTKLYAASVSNPYTTPKPGFGSTPASALNLSASAVNDIRIQFLLPFTPIGLPITQQKSWLLDAPNYDQLQLTIYNADALSVFTGQTTQPTFAAFGSTTGNPIVRVSGQYTMFGASRGSGYVPGRVWRYFYENVASTNLVTGGTGLREYNVPRGNRIRCILIKTGVKATTTAASNNAYSTLSNTIWSNVKFMLGLNKQIRFWADFYSLQFDCTDSYGVTPDVGFGLIDFANQGTQSEVLNTVGLIAGPTGDTDVYLQTDIAGASGQADMALYEELRGLPRNVAVVASATAGGGPTGS